MAKRLYVGLALLAFVVCIVLASAAEPLSARSVRDKFQACPPGSVTVEQLFSRYGVPFVNETPYFGCGMPGAELLVANLSDKKIEVRILIGDEPVPFSTAYTNSAGGRVVEILAPVCSEPRCVEIMDNAARALGAEFQSALILGEPDEDVRQEGFRRQLEMFYQRGEKAKFFFCPPPK